MSQSSETSFLKKTSSLSSREVTRALIIGLLFVTASVLVLELEILTDRTAELEVGDISSNDITAPSAISYQSDIATERVRNQAAELEKAYSRPDPTILGEQRVVANQVFNFLDSVRVDPFLSQEQKIDYILAIDPISFTPPQATAVIDLEETQWADAKEKIIQSLNEIMRQPIKEADLPSVRRDRLSLIVPSHVSQAEQDIISFITEDLIRPNSFIDEARTEERRQAARDAVQPVNFTYEENQIVVRAGERVDELNIEALAAMGLHQSTSSWHDYAAMALLLLLLVGAVGHFLVKYQIDVLKDSQRLRILVLICFVFVVLIRAMVPVQTVLPYALPMAALTIIIAGTLGQQLAMIVTLMMGVLVGYVAGNDFELAVYIVITGLIVSLQVRKMVQVNTLLRAGLYAMVSNVVLILLFRFLANDFVLQPTSKFIALISQLGSGVLGGLLSAPLAMLGLLIIGNYTGVITHLQLIDLSRPTQPLLAELLRRAPGTYHHTLVVSNLAEQAATRIGANAFLCRVGAYYHDIGKMVRPYFFTENARPGVSLHENLDPETSAQIIISHVTDGLRLAKENNLPPVLQAFIAEHHGTEIAGYSFYHQALEDADGDETQVDKSCFTHHGPKPQTKETAILMLADASEAAVRSVQPESAESVDKLVRKIIGTRMESGQFDECDLTMRDLEQIRIAFNEVLQGVAHQRVKYPDTVKSEAETSPAQPLPILPLAMQEPPLVKD